MIYMDVWACYRPNCELLPIFYDLHGRLSVTDLIVNFYLYFHDLRGRLSGTDLIVNFYLYFMIYMDVWALQN